MTFKKALSGIAAALLVFASAASAAKVGEKAPEFTLTDINGEPHSLSDYAGKVVVLEWTNYGCPFVKKHYNSGNMQALQEMATDKDVVWLTICSSAEGTQGHMSAKEWQKATAKKEVKATATLIDEAGSAGKAYGAIATPHMFVIDENGVLAYDGAIDSIPSANTSDIAKAENYVKSAITAVLEGKPVSTPKSKPYGCSIKYARDS